MKTKELSEDEKEKIRIENRKRFFERNKNNEFLHSMIKRAKQTRKHEKEIKNLEKRGKKLYIEQKEKPKYYYAAYSDKKRIEYEKFKPQIKDLCRARYTNKYILQELTGLKTNEQAMSAYISKLGYRKIYGKAFQIGKIPNSVKITPIIMDLLYKIPEHRIHNCLMRTDYTLADRKYSNKKIQHCKRMTKDVEYFIKERYDELWQIRQFPKLIKYLKDKFNMEVE